MAIRNSLGSGGLLGTLVISLLIAACSSDESTPGDTGGSGGEAGSGGTAGSAGSAGSSGTAGTAGSAGTAGTSGTAGSSGTAGTAGSGGTAGSAGSSGSSGSSGSAGTGGTAGSAGSSGSAGTGGTAGTAGTSGTAGAGGTGGAPDQCSPQAAYAAATVKDATNPSGTFGDLANYDGQNHGAFVRLNLVATTQKFLVSKSNAGTCLWGFFAVQSSGVVEEYASIQVVGKGANAVTDPTDPNATICPEEDGSAGTGTMPTGAGWIPNDLAPGETITVSGFVSEFPLNPMPSANCTEVSAAGQRQLKLPDQGCFVRGGTTTGVTAKDFSAPADLAGLTTLADADFQHKWGGAPIVVTGSFTPKQVATEQYTNVTDAVSKFGNINLNETPLVISNTIAFKSVLSNAPNRYDYPLSTTFTSFDGIYYRGFCSWNLSTTTKCGDVLPADSTCP